MFDSELENRLYLSSCVAIEERMTYLDQDNILYTGVYLCPTNRHTGVTVAPVTNQYNLKDPGRRS